MGASRHLQRERKSTHQQQTYSRYQQTHQQRQGLEAGVAFGKTKSNCLTY